MCADHFQQRLMARKAIMAIHPKLSKFSFALLKFLTYGRIPARKFEECNTTIDLAAVLEDKYGIDVTTSLIYDYLKLLNAEAALKYFEGVLIPTVDVVQTRFDTLLKDIVKVVLTIGEDRIERLISYLAKEYLDDPHPDHVKDWGMLGVLTQLLDRGVMMPDNGMDLLMESVQQVFDDCLLIERCQGCVESGLSVPPPWSLVEADSTSPLDTPLTIGDLRYVHIKLYEACTKWFDIGQCLSVDNETLFSIRGDLQFKDDGDRLREMLIQRLKLREQLTWRNVCDCLREPIVERSDLADTIEQELREFFTGQTLRASGDGASNYGSLSTNRPAPTVQANHSQVEATLLEVDTHLRPIKRALWEARAQWRDIGRALDLTDGTIRTIHEANDGECLHEVLSQWMRTGEATTQDLLFALEDVTVSRRDIANKMRALTGRDRTNVGL